MLIEICVASAADAEKAALAGADRVELCANLAVGGLTPSDGEVLAAAKVAPAQGLQILVRPRAGDFVHSAAEIAQIVADIQRLRQLLTNATVPVGFVVGALNSDNTINVTAAAAFREAAGSAPLTFHRAFDCVPEQAAALRQLLELGYDRVLTTGGDETVAQPSRLGQLAKHAQELNPDFRVLISGGLRAHNVAQIAAAVAAEAAGAAFEVHMRAPVTANPEHTDPQQVASIVAALR